MSREPRYRVWDKLRKKMIEMNEKGFPDIRNQKQRLTLFDWLQYIDKKDKNDVQICEGDIVKWNDGDYDSPSNPRIAIVEFSPELSFYAVNVPVNPLRDELGHKFGFSNFIYKDTENHLEIMGNIKENSELLEIYE